VVVGDEGKYAVLDKQGVAQGAASTLAGSGSLAAVSWSGSTFLIGGTAGRAQLLDEQGVAQGEPMTLLEGKDIGAIAWSGNVWLVAGADGAVQRVRPDGEQIAGVNTLAGFEKINAARWSGDEWLVAGTNQGVGTVQRVKSDATAEGGLITLNTISSLHAVEWSGREWIVGGTDGLVQIISAAGEPRTQPGPQPRDVLTGGTVYSIDFHDNKYLIAGENGLTRLLTQELLTSAPPVAVAGFETIYDARWTLARGYGRGECLTNDACYAGSCIGDLQGGFCCDRACDRPCESCLASDTDAVDGICSAVPAESMPVSEGCDAEDASTCGKTGLCDGAGECALHAPDVVCSDASCSTGDVTPESVCDGMGMCVTPGSTACAPYLTCDGAECGTSCSADQDCVDGYECVEGLCEVEMEEVIAPPPAAPPEEGCCAVVAPKKEAPSKWGLLGLLGVFLVRRRRKA
jgi:MYXO-CTERM domain-containing protein